MRMKVRSYNLSVWEFLIYGVVLFVGSFLLALVALKLVVLLS